MVTSIGAFSKFYNVPLFIQVQEMEQTLPTTCQITFNDPHRLHEFSLLIVPEEGYWTGGKFYFQIYIPDDYNMAVIISFLTLIFLLNSYYKSIFSASKSELFNKTVAS